ncbi:hypothetical protein JMUB5056_1644 [Leptotrichia hongkongensis]|uniref:Predicted membrane protein YciQ-like C-terminal domain-containing protein n=1 Tax=Leptotrichia hongkongensis TaxID=554406 RepID=A0A510L7R7_9FUSO|nr:DUF2207 domain-containing protein [Leptotrichia hongkongensis]BBM60050.1 hypothetical protein JMUB5056_1644 [Leptotrichia hongkongensis]
MEISLTQIIILLIMLITLVIYSYITWKKFGKNSVDEIISVSEPPKEISAMMAAYMDGSKQTIDLAYLGLLELISKEFVIIEDYVDLKNYKVTEDEHEIKKDKKTVEIVDIKKYYRQITKKKYGFNMGKINDYGCRQWELSEEERMILEFLIEYDKESILGYKNPIMNQLLKILEVLKEKFDGRGNYAFLYLIGIKSINREKWDKRFYNSNWKLKILYIIIIFLFGILLFIFEGMNAIVPLIVLFPTFFWAILLSNILFLILKTKGFPVLIKLMISLLIGVFCGIVYFSAGLMLFPFGIAGVIITLVTILLVLYFRNIGKFTDGGARIKKDLEGFKMYVKSGEVKKFNDVEELISYFKKILPFSQALKVQKHVVEMIKKSIEISGLEDKKEYIENTLNIFIYKNDKFMKSFGNEIFAKEILEKASNEALEGNYYEEF